LFFERLEIAASLALLAMTVLCHREARHGAAAIAWRTGAFYSGITTSVS
jgi:hypothetical protein